MIYPKNQHIALRDLQAQIDYLKSRLDCGCQCATLYYDTFDDFPVTGLVDRTYVDKAESTFYIWNGSLYVAI